MACGGGAQEAWQPMEWAVEGIVLGKGLENADTLSGCPGAVVSVTQGSHLFPALGAFELPILSMLTSKRRLVPFFFFFFVIPLFAFQLIEQMEILFLNYLVDPHLI